MIGLVVLLAIWPFHHAKPADSNFPVTQYMVPTCDKQDDLYFYLGEDKMIGISGASCEDAIRNWTQLHIDPVRMSRI